MSVANALLNILGLAPQFEQAQTIISATKTGVEAVNALTELLKSHEGAKFKERMIELMGGSHEVDGKVHIDVKPPEPAGSAPEMVWAWKDGFTGYALVSRADAVANGWPIYGEN